MARIVPGIRNKPRIVQDVCADCGATDPGWASLNRGILICDGCCSVHRSLGRHISAVKSLKKGIWHPSELSMIHSLNNSGANNIWEHTLLDPSSAKILRRKPQPADPVHPTKADFIRAKHQTLSFVFRPIKDDSSDTDKDVSKQLHASVRTSNLEISLRLLSLGADPNYLNDEKGNRPLHVAATAGQSSQIELLILYGADPGALDKDGRTSVDYARDSGFPDIADRLLDNQHELTDRLSFYLCGQKPDHKKGQHWIIPEMVNDSSVDSCGISKEAKGKLIALPDHSFEELSCDIYDEVDRRELDAIWLSLQNQSALLSDRCAVPFLPVNPELSSTRNQGRQKLARFNSREFATLIIDLLVEARRRMTGSSMPFLNPKDHSDATVARIKSHHSLTNTSPSSANNYFADRNNALRQTCPVSSRHTTTSKTTVSSALSQSLLNCTTSTHPSSLQSSHYSAISASTSAPSNHLGEQDDEPLYDSVASEDDYSSWERRRKLQRQQQILSLQKTSLSHFRDSDYQDVLESPKKQEPENIKENREAQFPVSLDEYLELKRHLELELKRHLELSESRIKELQESNVGLTTKLNNLTSMVHCLREENDTLRNYNSKSSLTKLPHSDHPPHFFSSPHNSVTPTFESSHHTPQCRSLSPTYEIPMFGQQNGESPHTNLRMRDSNSGELVSRFSSKQQRPYSMFESTRVRPPRSSHQSFNSTSDAFDYPHSYEKPKKMDVDATSEYFSLVSNLPSQDEVVRKTEMITKRIQELLLSAQDSQHEKFNPCSEQIVFAVKEMSSLFPKSGCPPIVSQAVHQLSISACRLQSECRNHITSQLHILDPGSVTQQVIQCAYDIAKAAKSLVTHFQ